LAQAAKSSITTIIIRIAIFLGIEFPPYIIVYGIQPTLLSVVSDYHARSVPNL
jgi:hypothetical protein